MPLPKLVFSLFAKLSTKIIAYQLTFLEGLKAVEIIRENNFYKFVGTNK